MTAHQQFLQTYNKHLAGKSHTEQPVKQVTVHFATGEAVNLPITTPELYDDVVKLFVTWHELFKQMGENVPPAAPLPPPQPPTELVKQIDAAPAPDDTDFGKRADDPYEDFEVFQYRNNDYLYVKYIGDEAPSVYNKVTGSLVKAKSPTYYSILKLYKEYTNPDSV